MTPTKLNRFLILIAAILGLAACELPEDFLPLPVPIPEEDVALTIYSPAPPTIMLNDQNVAIGEILATCPGVASVDIIPQALPDSINTINDLDEDVKPFHLPIVTPLDFPTARDNTAPDWHAYNEASQDLKFVSSLYEVTFGVLVFDPEIQTVEDLVGKRIAVPARPSSVRWTSEVLFEDGWDILDEVTFVDTVPPEVPDLVASGEIDAMTWNIMSETPAGFTPLLPPLLDLENARWLGVDEAVAERISQANPFTLESVSIAGKDILTPNGPVLADTDFLSFKQGLAAWDSTPDALVENLVSCLADAADTFGAGADFEKTQLDWPALNDDMIHPGAQ